MEIVPFISIEKKKIVNVKKDILQSDKNSEQNDKRIYILDADGVEKNRPNLHIYQRLSKNHDLWIDAGPRVLGDVVDSIMAGATEIVVRRDLWRELDISSIRGLTDNKIYTYIDLKKYYKNNTGKPLLFDADGAVVLNSKNQIFSDLKLGSYLKEICLKYKVYVYEQMPENIHYWDNLGVEGLLVDIHKVGDFK